jgi:phosphoglycerate dehydrogenase-like enzyme
MICVLLMMMRRMPEYQALIADRGWRIIGDIRSIYDSTVTIVGMGDIGSSFAKKMNALGAEVYGVRRHVHEIPDYVKGMYTMENMDEIIGECDVVALSLPETEETVHLFDEARLRKMKKGAILVNVGRGTAVITEDLLKIMKEGYLAGACLDVTDPEPLPKNHPLWNTEHVYITPHISGRFNAALTYDLVLNILKDNLVRYLNNEPLENVVNKKLGY